MCADKLCAYIVAIYSLLEAAGSVALGVIAILMIECILPPEVPDSSTSVNLVENFLLSFFRQYFYTQDKCSPLNYTIFPEYNQSIVANPTQTQGWLIGYLIDNSLLLLGSLCLLCGIAARKKWLINIYMSTMSSVILYDTVLTVVYGLDISVAIDPSKTNFTFFTISVFPGISNLPGPIDIDTGVDTGTILLVNTILIMVYFSRFVIFFIFNIVCYFVARAVGSKMIKPKATVAPYPETQRNAPPQQNPYPSHQTEDPHFHQPLQRQFYPQSHPYPHPIPQGLAPRLNPVYSEIFDSGHTGYASAPPGSYYNPGFATGENMSKTRMSPEPVRIPDKDTKMLRQQDLAASSPPAYQLPAVDYDIVDNKPDSHYGNKNSGFSDIDSIGSNPTSPVRRSSSDISRSRPRRTSNSSVSSEAVAPELKGQLPWSYVRPEQLPTRGSKGLREFYINKQKKEGVMGKLDAPQESDEEDYDKRDIVPSYDRY